jgi:vancomycin resistance protein YoaR
MDDVSTVNLPLQTVAPPPGEVERLGLLSEIGRGESQFEIYASPGRDSNVQAGGHDIDGVLVPPGDIFSFTATVGSITWDKGYRWGEMIEAGQIRPSVGGGICQVSTTVFRAAFWSGLEIVERHAHSWRLPWYELGAPPGMDATIALGGPDLKIRNNTAAHILIRVQTDLIKKRQTVIIYGTPTNRRVEMAHAGSGSRWNVERTVLAGDTVLAQDRFTSSYSR